VEQDSGAADSEELPQRTIKQAHELALKYRDLLDRGIDPRKADRSLVVGNGAAKARSTPKPSAGR